MQAVNRDGPRPDRRRCRCADSHPPSLVGAQPTQLANALRHHLPTGPEVRTRGQSRLGLDAGQDRRQARNHRRRPGWARTGRLRSRAIIYAQLSTPGATELLAAFANISDGDARRALLTLSQALSTTPGERKSAAA